MTPFRNMKPCRMTSRCCLLFLFYIFAISAGQGVRLEQNKKTDADLDDLLKDEQLFMADRRIPAHSSHSHQRTINKNSSTSLSSSSSKSSSLSSKDDSLLNPVGGSTVLKSRTSSTPKMQYPGITPHLITAVHQDSNFEEDMAEDFLIFEHERETMERLDERRIVEEQRLAHRVKRQTTVEGSGVNVVDGEITTEIPWNADFLVSSSTAYTDLQSSSEATIQQVLDPMSQTVTVSVTGFRQGSTIIEFTVDFADGDIDRTSLARQLLTFRSTGFTYNGQTYDVNQDPEIKDGTSLDTLRPSTCYICATYQTCILHNGTADYYCHVSSPDFFEFGINQGDQTLANNRKRLSVVSRVPGGLPVADQTVNRIALSMNGLISFGEKYNSFTARTLPRKERLLLCGYWARMQLSSDDPKSAVWYHVYEKTSSMSARDEAMLASGKQAVELYGDVASYDPTFMLVATFEEIPPSPSNDLTSERVNFQMVIISNGESTYAMVIYASGGMQWSADQIRPVTIGLMADNLDIDKARPDTVIGNTNQPGVWFFELGALPDDGVNAEQECLTWYYQQLSDKALYQQVEADMPQCPCSYTAALMANYYPYSLQDGVICLMILPFYDQYGKTCCYEAPGVFVPNRPVAGTFLQHHPLLDPSNNYLQDQLPKQRCCQESNLCALYYDARPSGQCLRVIVIFIGLGTGDPHVTTIDGLDFQFNAIGEFVMYKLDTPSLKFELQSRTCQALSGTGEPVAASVFCAFVAKGNNSDTLQVELSQSKDSLVVYANGQDITINYRDEGNTFQRVYGGLILRRSNNTIRATFREGVSLNISVANMLLTFDMSMGAGFNGSVGLMGNANGLAEDDFTFPNRTTISNNTSERDILAYGKTWAVTDSTTLFTYESGKNTAYYTNDSFVPIFLSEVNDTVRQQAEFVCGGPEDIGCVFDYIATNNEALALGTKRASDQVQSNIKTAANSVPVLSGPSQINVTQNTPYTFTLSASDEEDSDTPSYVIVQQPTSSFAFDNSTQTADWTPSSNDTSRLEFIVTDSEGANSASLQIQIVQCSGCNNHGTCNFEQVRPQAVVDEYFQVAVCDCEPYYTGDDCEANFDACADDPCPLLTTCTDLSPAEHNAQGIDSTGYNCSDCPIGYTLNVTDDGPDCYDVDECSNNPCSHICTNTEGSFTCSCRSGYRLDTTNATVCNDIDECQENTDTCQQECINNLGSFTCGCLAGFSLNSTSGNTCIRDAAQDPCQSLANSCDYGCLNTSGKAQCICPKGFSLTTNGTHCQDINECDQNLCSQTCSNTEGSYICSCFPGFQLDGDKITCNECPVNKYGDNCTNTCECRGRGTCDRVRGCQCVDGWSGITCNDDVNECETANACPATQLCSNTMGSFVCSCPSGFTKVNDTLCVDIDECAVPSLNTCEQTCTNTQGSFVCSCNPGYTYVASNNTCLDIDECSKDTSQCEQLCYNFPGTVNCQCRQGYVLNDDRKTCTKEQDPCEQLSSSKNCSYGCQIVGGLAECYCQSGYQLAVDDKSCVDINECSSNTTNRCSQQCSNTPGGYTCSCSTGYTLDNDQRTCTVCDSFHWGENCANDCNCSPLGTDTCDPLTGCVCKDGWLGTLCDQDRDECVSSPCMANAQCTDTAGSYRCDCVAGYVFNGTATMCEDVNECDNNPCDQSCNNTEGSYVCSCDSGFTSNGDSCNDIDECLSNPCDQVCRNTVGGFACECYAGFLLNATTRTTCYAQTVCNSSNTCQQGCRVVSGAEQCFCNPGYQQNSTNTDACDDIDECLNSPCVNGTCANNPGGFSCSCAAGTYLLNDDITCQVCPEGKYGSACSSDCTCNSANTATCNAITGLCLCTTGWMGANCSVDTDECSDTPPICNSVSNSTCQNLVGSYYCKCNLGFSSSGGKCIACDDIHYGEQCANLCTCERANTQDCDDVSGACTCNTAWQGANCTVDVNECTQNSSLCTDSPFQTCRNFDGGYVCDCVSGYDRASSSDTCTDVNECLYTSLNICNQTTENCVNSAGSFQCVCKSGFSGTAGSCTDVNECNNSSLNTCNDRQDCVNSLGSYTCPCKSAYILINGVCADIDECSQATLNNCTDKETCVNNVGGFSCVCNSGYTRGSSGLCTATYVNMTFILTLDFTADVPLTDSTTSYYIDLLNAIQSALAQSFGNSIGTAFHAVIVTNLRSGSVVVSYQLQVDASQTSNPEGLAAKGVEDIFKAQVLNINGTDRLVQSSTIANTTLSSANTVCDVFNAITTCTVANEQCQVDDNGVPSCREISDDDNFELIIGLGVGIPLFFIVCIIIAVIIYLCVKKKRDDAASEQRAEASEHRFPSIFAGQLATKGSWGAAHRYQMYSPDNMSVSHGSDSSGDAHLLRGRRQGRSDFQDSAWYDNKAGASASAVSPTTPRRDRGGGDEGAVSNFSWEYMFRLLAPYKGGFEIQRPNVDPSPNPAYTPRSRGPRPDSMA